MHTQHPFDRIEAKPGKKRNGFTEPRVETDPNGTRKSEEKKQLHHAE